MEMYLVLSGQSRVMLLKHGKVFELDSNLN